MSRLDHGQSDRWVAVNRSILARVLANTSPRDFAIRFWNGESILPDPGVTPRFTLVLNRPGALRRMFSPFPRNDVALGEAFVRGDFDVEGDLIAATSIGERFVESSLRMRELISLGRDLLALPNDAGDTSEGRQRAQLRGALHSRERDRAAIQYHYDVGNDFYALWLDASMVYSCAYFKTGAESIDAAQEAKLDVLCRKLRLNADETLLDIGCGWGGLAMYAAEKYGVNALGVTLSEKQAALAKQRIREANLDDRARVELLDYRDLSAESFDKIVSVGMFEHVGRARLDEYFRQAYRLLKPRGVFLNHGIAANGTSRPSNRLTRFAAPQSFVDHYVFPDGELVPIHDALEFAERAGFEVRDVESWREHYARTLRHWVSRLEAHYNDARRVVDERTYRVWRLYMAASAHAFDSAMVNVYQAVLGKPDAHGVSGLPWTREDWYA
jgi:cyclopropane-fatty-acyl-phospholipid synthase